MKKIIFLLTIICLILAVDGCKSTKNAEVSVPPNFVLINGAAFLMGSPAAENSRRDNETQHRVEVGSFYISKYQLTVAEFRAFTEKTGYKTAAEKDGGGNVYTGNPIPEARAAAFWDNPFFEQGEDHPVVLVSWIDAAEYCNWLSSEERLKPAYTINGENVRWDKKASGYRLPTEAEWEYACRSGTETPFNTGANITSSQANYNGNFPYQNFPAGEFRMRTLPVGSFEPNKWGLYDFHGNVREWCWDIYGVYNTGNQKDPEGAAEGNDRVIRNGGWFSHAHFQRSASRDHAPAFYRVNHLGFRLVRPIP